MFDPVKKALGLVHAGVRGTDLGIARKAVSRMKKKYNCDPKDLIVAFGPAARADTYIKDDPKFENPRMWKPFLKRTLDGRFMVDFVGCSKWQILESGVFKKNIIDCGINTMTDERFFSHRLDSERGFADQGRFACVVGIK